MSKIAEAPAKIVGGKIALSVIIGGFVGKYLDWELNRRFGTPIFSYDTHVLTQADVGCIIIGMLLALFGSRVHSFLKWLGVGILAFELVEELYEISPLKPFEAVATATVTAVGQ